MDAESRIHAPNSTSHPPNKDPHNQPAPSLLKHPTVSILVATYNGEKYLHKQLDSIINQTYQNLEIIIQDDGSTDSTLSILEDYAAKDPRIQVSQNKSNLGIIQNFYDLISKSSGAYIAISDQDDIWETNKIEVLLENISGSSLIYTDSVLIRDDDSPWGMTLLENLGHTPKSGLFLMDLLTENTISGHACLFCSNLKDRILKHRYRKFHDTFMYDQLVGTIASFHDGVTYYDQALTRHRIHASNNHNSLATPSTPVTLQRTRRETTRLPFFARKRKRARIKIERAYDRLLLLESMLNDYATHSKNVFELKPDPKVKFKFCFFNRSLYQNLIKIGIHEETARKLSIGRLHYLFCQMF